MKHYLYMAWLTVIKAKKKQTFSLSRSKPVQE